MNDTEKPNLKQGIPAASLPDNGNLLGTVEGDQVVLLRRGAEFFALSAHCTHYGGPLAEGLVVGDTVRCPWHHACFSLRTGEALRAPALDPVSCWRVEERGDKIFVREKITAPAPKPLRDAPASVVIVGGGAAGLAAANMLRREGYDGHLTIVSADDSPPGDRPNLSKDYLAGTAKEDWVPLRSMTRERDVHFAGDLSREGPSVAYRASILNMIRSASIMAWAIALSLAGEGRPSQLVRCLAARILAAIKRTRLRPSSMQRRISVFAFCSPQVFRELDLNAAKSGIEGQ